MIHATERRNIVILAAFLALVSCGNPKMGTGVRVGTIVCVKNHNGLLVELESAGRRAPTFLLIPTAEMAAELRAHVGKKVEFQVDTYKRSLSGCVGVQESCTSFRVIEGADR